jgi:hypothetical protein
MAENSNPFSDLIPKSSPAGGGGGNMFTDLTPGGVPIGPDGKPRVVINTAEKKEDRGATDAAMRGAMSGVTANFYDELKGMAAAGGGGTPEMGGQEGVHHIIMGLAKYLAGNDEARQKYDEVVKRERDLSKTAGEQHPIASTAGEIAGAIALPGGAAIRGATLPARMTSSAAVGGAYGATSGAGEGEGAADTASRATMGGILGTTIGAVAPPIVEGVISGVSKAVSPIVNAVRGAISPDTEAARRVATAVTRDAKADPLAQTRLTPGEFGQNVQEGGPATIMDMGGGLTRRLADSAAITSPEAGTALNTAINNRFEGQAPRIVNWLKETFRYPDAHAQQEAIRQVAKTVNAGAYERVMTRHPVVDVPAEITERPAVAQAMKDAVSLAKNYGEKLESAPEVKTILSGPGYHIADEVASPAKTSLRYWDYVKKAMDARIEGMKRGGGIEDLNGKEKADFRGLVDARNSLVDHLDSKAPGYHEARAGAAKFFGAEDALEAGQNFVKAKLGNEENITTTK